MKKNMGKNKRKGGKLIPALCNLTGALILAAAVGSCLPLSIPRFLGYEIYNVVSGSMEPEIPVGSAVYVKAADPESIGPDEVIAFQGGDSVVIHRVVKNNAVEGRFTTKGDANAEEDVNAVDYAALVGRVTAHYPMLGELMTLYTGKVGKAYLVCFAACGAMLNILAGRMRERRRALELEEALGASLKK